MPNKMIAYELGITEGTVKQYITQAMHRLGLQNRTELSLWYHMHYRPDQQLQKEHNCQDCVLYAVRCAALKQPAELLPAA